jgi:diguanylate cyclase (GGDEF)-like protein
LAQLCLTFGFVLMLNYRLANDLNDLAMHDALTGAFNRRSLETELVRMLARCSRTGDVIAVIMMDVDHFKTVNDRHGHAAGDEVLRRLSAVAQDSIRTEDFFARYGGEEFCIVLPSTTAEKARDLAERLRRNYAEMTVRYADQAIQSTVSIGIADSRQSGVSMDCLLNYADQALYRAKREGRNRSLIFEG